MSVNTTNIKFNVMVATAAGFPWRFVIHASTSGDTVFSANRAGTTAWDYFSDTPANNDAVYFGILMATGDSVVQQKWRDITLQVGTALNGGTLVWEYCTAAGTWAALTVTNGDAMKTTGAQTVTFRPPKDWWYATKSSKAMYVRCRMSSNVGVTEGGANATTAVKMGTNCIHVHGNASGTAVTLEDIYDTAVNQVWDVSPTQIMSGQKGNEGYYFDCNIAIGSQSEALTGFLDLRGNLLVFETDCMLISKNSNSNKLNGGALSQSPYAYLRPTILTNQHSNNQWFALIGNINVYGLTWINYREGAAPAYANRATTNTLSGIGSGAASAANTSLQDCHFFGFQRTEIKVNHSSGSLKNVSAGMGTRMGDFQAGSIDGLHIMDDEEGLYTEGFPANVPIYNPLILNSATYQFRHYDWNQTIRIRYYDGTITIPTITTGNTVWGGGGFAGRMHIQPAVDIKVIDENGNAISGAVVSMTPTGTLENENNFSVTTAADGTITRQYITKQDAKANSSNPVTITTYTPFTLRVSKPGFVTKIYRGITPTTALNWTITLESRYKKRYD